MKTSTDTWIERVRAADADAEQCWHDAQTIDTDEHDLVAAIALIAIAAELRAQRIARRPGAGKS